MATQTNDAHQSINQTQQALVARLLQSAFDAKSNGQSGVAKNGCDRVLALDPNQADALHLRGLIAYEEGDSDSALSWLRRAGADRADVLNTLGNVLADAGRFDESIESLRSALALEPEFAMALNNLGTVLLATRQFPEAEKKFRRALAIDSGYVEAHYNLGLALADQGRVNEAIERYRIAIQHDALHAQAHRNLGLLLLNESRLAEAKSSLIAAADADPDFAQAHADLALVLHQLGEWDESERHYREALRLQPDDAVAHDNFGVLQHDQGKLSEAIASHRRALALKPQDADAHHNLAGALQDAGDRLEALQAYRKALDCDGEHASSAAALHHQLRHECAWDEMSAIPRHLLARAADDGLAAPFTRLCDDTSASEQLTSATAYSRREFPGLVSQKHRRHAGAGLRVGYLSSDFRDHPVAYLMGEVFELHDRSQVEVYAYSSFGQAERSAARQRIREAAHHFVDVEALSIKAAAQRIHQDSIDVLIDLGGYTQHARTGVLALRPAPVQVNYLGYPGTMGAPFIDYLITDRFVTPPESQAHFSEKFVYMPHCFQPNDRKKVIAENIPDRKACGLPEEGFVFCSFNKSYKFTPRVFEVWMRLLKSVAGSVLWLSDGSVTAMDNLRREAQRFGVDPRRVVFAERVDTVAEHLGRQRHADLFLDTLPYNAHTTASDALWAGLPVLTCAGEAFASRVAGSLLHAVGLPELVTNSLTEYEALALRLAGDPHLLANYRQRLSQNRLTTPLFDSAQFVKHLECAYQTMRETFHRREY